MQPKAKAEARAKYQEDISKAAVCKTDEELELSPPANRTLIEFAAAETPNLGNLASPLKAATSFESLRILT